MLAVAASKVHLVGDGIGLSVQSLPYSRHDWCWLLQATLTEWTIKHVSFISNL
jgi:hypothetical protein